MSWGLWYDGVIDNIDVDNDNDGLLDCFESLGDKMIDLTNTSELEQLKIYIIIHFL